MSPSAYLAKAERALASARLLLADDDREGACNRAYYAMFDAAHAALLHQGALANPAKTRALKPGMMQELLTGRIRLA